MFNSRGVIGLNLNTFFFVGKGIAMSSSKESFLQFRIERVREAMCGYPGLLDETATLKDIQKAYNRWIYEYNNKKKIDVKEFRELCNKHFGDSANSDKWKGIRVFLYDEDLEEFDQENEASLEELAKVLKDKLEKKEAELNNYKKGMGELKKTLDSLITSP